MPSRSTQRFLLAGAALTLAFGLGGCSAISGLFGGGDSGKTAERDESTNEVVEEGSQSAFDVSVGDCLDFPAGDTFEDITVKPCDQEHEGEIYYEFDMPAGEWPGDEAIYAEGDAKCAAEFQTFVGSDPNTSTYGFTYFTPLEDGWATGDHKVQCIVGKWNAAGNGFDKVTGSAAGLAQ